MAAFLVAWMVQRLQYFLAELAGLFQDRLDHVRRRIDKIRHLLRHVLGMQHLGQDELDLAQWRFIGGHLETP